MSETEDSSRWVWAATIVLAAMLTAAVCAAAFWPRIELAYHRHYFRRGTERQQIEALEWICRNRLEEGMTREKVKLVFGEPLEKRFAVWTYHTTVGSPEQPAMIPVPVFRFPRKSRGTALPSHVNLYFDPNDEIFIRAEGNYIERFESYEEALKRVAPDSIHECFRRYNRRRRERREPGAGT